MRSPLRKPLASRVACLTRRWDILLILLISVAAEAAHFSVKRGRCVISSDSVQFVDNAEALLTHELDPSFALLKPGYSFFLAGVGLAFGNMGWAVVAIQHALQALLPLAAYGLGTCLVARWIGWLAAGLMVCRLQTFIRAERIMSETLYVFLLSFGVLALAWALSRRRAAAWLLLSGALLALAWLTRSVAVAVIVAAIAMILWSFRSTPRRALTYSAAFALPVLVALLAECGLNYQYSGQFRTSTGFLGPAMTVRCRFMQGVPFPQTETAQRCLELLPERTRELAYLANKLDAPVARYRAVHEKGMTEWELDALMSRASRELILADPLSYARQGALLAGVHLLRRPLAPSTSPVPDSRRRPILLHHSAPDNETSQRQWYSYWALPNRSLEHSLALVGRMNVQASAMAPFGAGEPWRTLRYLSMHPVAVRAIELVNHLGSLWPGFAILLCAVVGLNRRVCVFVGLAYLLDAAIIGVAASTYASIGRMEDVWLAVDTTLTAAFLGATALCLVNLARTRSLRAPGPAPSAV